MLLDSYKIKCQLELKGQAWHKKGLNDIQMIEVYLK